MSLRDEFKNHLKVAMRAKQQTKVNVLRLISAALKDRDIAARSSGNNEGIAENDILQMLQTMIKQRNESIQAYRAAGREDMANAEAAEIDIIQEFLPQQMDDEKLNNVINAVIKEQGATSMKDMGNVMSILRGRHAGEIDSARAATIIKSLLA